MQALDPDAFQAFKSECSKL